MRTVQLYIAISLDGFIAKPDGDVKWLEEIPNPDKTDHGYADFYADLDTTLMGFKTYDKVLGYGIENPYPTTTNYVFSRNSSHADNDEYRFISQDPVEFTKQLKAQPGKNIWLIGGGQINTLLLNAGLIDEFLVFVMPIILGKGIPLFGGAVQEQSLALQESKIYTTGAMMLRYTLPQ